jgi:hypothetical protein
MACSGTALLAFFLLLQDATLPRINSSQNEYHCYATDRISVALTSYTLPSPLGHLLLLDTTEITSVASLRSPSPRNLRQRRYPQAQTFFLISFTATSQSTELSPASNASLAAMQGSARGGNVRYYPTWKHSSPNKEMNKAVTMFPDCLMFVAKLHHYVSLSLTNRKSSVLPPRCTKDVYIRKDQLEVCEQHVYSLSLDLVFHVV